MHIEKLDIRCFRNIAACSLQLSPRFNILTGENGAGKTSLIEAVYTLSYGRSFRTSIAANTIMHKQSSCSAVATIDHASKKHLIGCQKNADGSRALRIDGEPTRSASHIAKLLPTQLITTSSYRLFTDGPKGRRQFIDWGIFYESPAFSDQSADYQHALRQRNAAIKAGAPIADIQVWDEPLADLAQKIDVSRETYIQQLMPTLSDMLNTFLPAYSINIEYNRGWHTEKPFIQALADNIGRDRQIGYTTIGPHRADIQLLANNVEAQNILSQGQQKLAAYSLFLAQGQRLSTQRTTPTYLIDDLPAELDENKQGLLIATLKQLGAQVIVTAISNESLQSLSQDETNAVFTINKGLITTESPCFT